LKEDHLKGCGLEVPVPGVKAKWPPDTAALTACRGFGRKIGEVAVK